MSVVQGGHGRPVVFVHGNPTSAQLWRNVLAQLSDGFGQCLAVDLIGMGRSAKLPGAGGGTYRYHVQRRYFGRLLDELDPTGTFAFVGHDWGAVLAVDWARSHPERVRGIAYLETLVAPVQSGTPNEPEPTVFGPLRSAAGEQLVLQDNIFIEMVLQAGTLRPLGVAELDLYREPYLSPGEDRRPMLDWARAIPIDGRPADVHDIVAGNARWMATTATPKLFINGDPGALLTGPLRELCRTWPRQDEITVPGMHFLPEDSPEPIARALTEWLAGLR